MDVLAVFGLGVGGLFFCEEPWFAGFDGCLAVFACGWVGAAWGCLDDPVFGAFAEGSWGWLWAGCVGGGGSWVGCFSNAYAFAHGGGLGGATEAYRQFVGLGGWVGCVL